MIHKVKFSTALWGSVSPWNLSPFQGSFSQAHHAQLERGGCAAVWRLQSYRSVPFGGFWFLVYFFSLAWAFCLFHFLFLCTLVSFAFSVHASCTDWSISFLWSPKKKKVFLLHIQNGKMVMQGLVLYSVLLRFSIDPLCQSIQIAFVVSNYNPQI